MEQPVLRAGLADVRTIHGLGAAAILLVLEGHALGADPNAAFEHPPGTAKAPGDAVVMQLDDAEIGDLVRFIGELTGKRFVFGSPKAAKLRASVVAKQKVTAAEAYQTFLAVLTANGLTVVPQSGFYKIVETQDVARQLTPLVGPDVPAEERYVTRIHRLHHRGAEEVTTSVLSKLATKDASIVPYGQLLIITETAANIRRLMEVLDVVDQAGTSDQLWFRTVRHLPAGQVEKELTEILALGKGKGDSAAGSDLHIARIVATERPNAIVVVGTRASFERVSELLDTLDVAPSNEVKVQVVMLQNADAKKIVVPINEALGAAGGASGNAGTPGGGRAATASGPAAALEAPVKVSADETTNALIVSSTPRDFIHVRDVIRALDRPKRQVFIEAAILEVSAERGLDLGVSWHGGDSSPSSVGANGTQTTYGGFRAVSSAGPPSATDLQAFALGIRGPSIPFASIIPGISSIPSFGTFLRAVATSQGSDILSTPSVIASDNTAAELKVQLQTSLQPNAPSASLLAGLPGAAGAAAGLGLGGLPTASSVGASYKGIGPRVKVTPHLNDSNQVRLDVDEVISDIQNQPQPGDTFGTISYVERTATTTLTVEDSHTVVIGGLMRNRVARSESKVPLLGDLPLLGALFRTRSDKVEKSNLILVLTPHIIRDDTDMKRIFQRKMDERQELIDHDALFESQEWSPPKDWAKNRGLLAELRHAYRTMDQRRRELAELPPEGGPPTAVTPIDLPVPESSTPPPAGPKPTAPTVRTVEP